MYNSVCHIEFEVTNLDRSAAFYKALFDWKFAEFEMPDMKVFGYDDKHIGGLQRADVVKTGSSPTIWFRVKNLDEMMARAQSLGASVIAPRSDVPNVGWSACIADLDGNPVGMVQYSEDAS